MTRPPASIMIPHWMSRKLEAKRIDFRDRVSVIGEFPYSPTEIQLFLSNHDILLQPFSDETQVVVLGQISPDYDLRKLKGMLMASAHTSPLLYSQEMFVAFLLTGMDPLEEDEGELDRFVTNYPSFDTLMDSEFGWPTTNAVVGEGEGTFGFEAPAKGLLAWFGYHVGETGVRADVRRPLLIDAFNCEALPDHFPEPYRRLWGEPRSAKRLKRIADSIASFCRTAKRRSNPPLTAIRDWEADLSYLFNKMYKNRFKFHWPDPDNPTRQ